MTLPSTETSAPTSKRICASQEHTQSELSNRSGTTENSLSAELTARLQTVGSRIRKSVLEGHKTRPAEFQNFYSSSVPGSPRSSSPPPIQRTIFKTSDDAFHEALRDLRRENFDPTSSPRKRAFESESHRDDEQGPETMETDIVPELGYSTLPVKHRFDDRPLKPLKRVFGKTQSAPAGALRFTITTPQLDYEPIDVDAFMDAF